jgi:hypothetical protein
MTGRELKTLMIEAIAFCEKVVNSGEEIPDDEIVSEENKVNIGRLIQSMEDMANGTAISPHKLYFTEVLVEHAKTGLQALNKNTTKIVTPQGGEYLIGVIHITGPKIKFEDGKIIEELEEV